MKVLCVESVFMELDNSLAFKKGKKYTVEENISYHPTIETEKEYETIDENKEEHILGYDNIEEQEWFNKHFKIIA